MNAEVIRSVLMVFGALISAICALGVVSPGKLIEWVKDVWDRSYSMVLAVGVRLLLGVMMLVVAPDSRYPIVFQVIGCIALAAAVAIPFVGRERIGKLIAWGETQSPAIFRSWCLIGVAFGVFIIFALS